MSTRANPTRSVPHRIAGANGSMPVDARPPRPPPVLVLYPDLVDAEDIGPAPVYGQYPRALIGKLLPWLRCARHEVLHVCSGSLPRGEGIRVDIRPEARPDVLADGRALPFADGSIAAALCDPPYSAHYARELYGVEYPRPSHLLREMARVVRSDRSRPLHHREACARHAVRPRVRPQHRLRHADARGGDLRA